MNSKSSKTSYPHRLLFNATGQINLKRSINTLLYQTVASTIHQKKKKSPRRTINLKYKLEHGMKNLSYLVDFILYQIFKIILNIPLKGQRNI